MNSDKKKRLIIPVATLVVATVMMAGVGYAAISSTFTVTENSTAGGELKVSVDGINTATDKILNGAKIPYGVNTKDGTTKEYTIADGTYVLKKDIAVTITDNTCLEYNKYKITTSIESTKLGGITGITLGCVVTNGAYTEGPASLTEFAKEDTSNLKLTVVLTADGVSGLTNPDMLKTDDITISITIEGAFTSSP